MHFSFKDIFSFKALFSFKVGTTFHCVPSRFKGRED